MIYCVIEKHIFGVFSGFISKMVFFSEKFIKNREVCVMIYCVIEKHIFGIFSGLILKMVFFSEKFIKK